MAVFRRLVLIALSARGLSQGAAPTDGCAQQCEPSTLDVSLLQLNGAAPTDGCARQCEPSTLDVSLLQLNGMLKAIESVLDLEGEQGGHLIHTPNGPRVAHMSHLPVQAAIPDASVSASSPALPDQSVLLQATRDESRDDVGAVDLHTDDPHHVADPHAVPAPHPPPQPDAHPEPAPPHSDDPAPRQEPPAAQTPAPADARVKEGYENAHPAELSKEKYAYLNGLAAFAIGPGIFFLALLVVTTFGLFVYAYKNDPRVFG